MVFVVVVAAIEVAVIAHSGNVLRDFVAVMATTTIAKITTAKTTTAKTTTVKVSTAKTKSPSGMVAVCLGHKVARFGFAIVLDLQCFVAVVVVAAVLVVLLVVASVMLQLLRLVALGIWATTASFDNFQESQLAIGYCFH